MARFSYEDADNYGGNGGHGFFSLQNDKDVASVRFLYDGMSDVQGYAVHEVELDGKKRYVNCLREYNQPLDVCPFCKAKRSQLVKLFIPVYDIQSDTVKIWERGKKFFGQISGICSRYAQNEPLCSHVFEIERSGKKGDTSTTYNIFEVDRDNTTLEDLPEVPEIIGGLVLDKSADDMEYYLDHNEFPKSGDSFRRTNERTPYDEEPVRRRTPATGRDAF